MSISPHALGKDKQDHKVFQEQVVVAKPKIDAKELQTFLNHVVWGRQDEAEAMLKSNKELVLASGDVTDPAKRTFKTITGFQYAVWALDWKMWTMLLLYLPPDTAMIQAKGQVEHANWKNLTDALQVYIDNYEPWTAEQCRKHWVEQVGGAQFKLPIHVLQEYNNPNRPFEPCPNFSAQYPLKRSLPDWLDKGLSQAKFEFGILRYHSVDGAEWCHGDWRYDEYSAPADRSALIRLYDTRVQQRGKLETQILLVQHEKLQEEQIKQLQYQDQTLQKEIDQLMQTIGHLKLDTTQHQTTAATLQKTRTEAIAALNLQLKQLNKKATQNQVAIEKLKASNLEHQKEQEKHQNLQQKIDEHNTTLTQLNQEAVKAKQKTLEKQQQDNAKIEGLQKQLEELQQHEKGQQAAKESLETELKFLQAKFRSYGSAKIEQTKLQESLDALKQQEAHGYQTDGEQQKERKTQIEQLKQALEKEEVHGYQVQETLAILKKQTQELQQTLELKIKLKQEAAHLKQEIELLKQELSQQIESANAQQKQQETTCTALQQNLKTLKEIEAQQQKQHEAEQEHLNSQLTQLQVEDKRHNKEIQSLKAKSLEHDQEESEHQEVLQDMEQLIREIKKLKQIGTEFQEKASDQMQDKVHELQRLKQQISQLKMTEKQQKEEISKLKAQWAEYEASNLVDFKCSEEAQVKTAVASLEIQLRMLTTQKVALLQKPVTLLMAQSARLQQEAQTLQKERDVRSSKQIFSQGSPEAQRLRRKIEKLRTQAVVRRQKNTNTRVQQLKENDQLAQEVEDLRELVSKEQTARLNTVMEQLQTQSSGQDSTELNRLKLRLHQLNLNRVQSLRKKPNTIVVEVVAQQFDQKIFGEFQALQEKLFKDLAKDFQPRNPLLEAVLEKEGAEQQRLREKRFILTTPQLSDYYYFFQLQFNDAFLACKVIHSGMVANNDSTPWDTVNQGLQALSKHIPLGGIVLDLLSNALQTISNLEKKKRVNRAAQFLPGAASIEQVGELLARQLTLAQLNSLPQILSKPKAGFFQKHYQNLISLKDALLANDLDTELRKFADQQCKKLLLAIFEGEIPENPNLDAVNAIEPLLQVILKPHYVEPNLRSKAFELALVSVVKSVPAPLLLSNAKGAAADQVIQALVAVNENSATLKSKLDALQAQLAEAKKSKCCF